MTAWGINDTIETQARRIASLAYKIQQQQTLDPVEMEYEDDIRDGKWFIYDGAHRIRAYVFLKQDMPCIMKKLKM